MSVTYLDQIGEKKYTANVVVKISDDLYFAIRQPDSGLSIASPYAGAVVSLILNPTTIDIQKVTTTISSFSFRLLDVAGTITALVLGDASNLIGQEVRIYLGRSNVGMDFADYFELPLTYIIKVDHVDNSYSFASSEQTQRMDKPIYSDVSALGVDILVGTTIWTMRDTITSFPATGFLKVDNEFVSYTGIDSVNNRFTGVVRGELNSVPAVHAANTDCMLVETLTDNPLNIILKLLCSGGGGGTYDVLQRGLAIDHTLIDIAGIEALRDELFLTNQYTLSFYSIASALKYLETELLMPNGLRFTYSRSSQLTLAILDRARFVEEDDVIDEDTMTKYPNWSLDGAKVVNSITVQWDFNEATGLFQKLSTYTDAASVTLYGAQTPLAFLFSGPKASLDGQTLVDDFGNRLLARISTPTPQIQINTQIDKSLQNIGDKAYIVSSKIPAADGTLDFSSDLEIISRAINHTTGDVQFKLAFTSFTNIRSGFIAPTDLVNSFEDQRTINIVEGRGSYYLVGWFMRLWDDTLQAYCADAPNQITSVGLAGSDLLTEGGDDILLEDGGHLLQESVTEDTIVFADLWATTLIAGQHRIRFCDYDTAIASQKRYGFISDTGGTDFDDGKPSYKVTY